MTQTKKLISFRDRNPRPPTRTGISWLAAVLVLGGCGKPEDARSAEDAKAIESPGVDPGTNATERAILEQAESLPSGVPTKVGSSTVTAEDIYSAASGALCRNLTIRAGKSDHHRLACEGDGGWFFTADVMNADGDKGAP